MLATLVRKAGYKIHRDFTFIGNNLSYMIVRSILKEKAPIQFGIRALILL